MKKAFWTVAMAALAVGLSACASTSAATKPTLEDLAAQVDDLQRQNTELRGKLDQGTVRPNGSVQQDAVNGPLPSPTSVTLLRPEDMIPPPAQMRRGPPQNWAWLHTPPSGCSGGIYALTLVNQTDYYANILIDGESLRVRGARGMLPGVPPHEKVYMCLGNMGKHTFTGEIFALRYGQANRVGTYRFEATFSGNSAAYGGQEVVIRDFWITWTDR
jgi:hypothetical protein